MANSGDLSHKHGDLIVLVYKFTSANKACDGDLLHPVNILKSLKLRELHTR